MALSAEEKAKLLDDFRSGRNAMAFLPLCTALRRERRHAEALEICQQGLLRAPSAAGRIMQARLMADLGHYDGALGVLDRLDAVGDPSAATLAERARCLIALQRFDDAQQALALLDDINPMDPSAQVLRSELRAARGASPVEARVQRSPARAGMDEIAAALRAQLAPLGQLLSLALLDLDTGKSHVEGEAEVLETAEILHMENAQACSEMDFGELSSTTVELEHAWMLVVRRRRRMAVIVFASNAPFGKWHHRVHMALDRLMQA
jgi:tetratricopeptide (TPR) repeat protein